MKKLTGPFLDFREPAGKLFQALYTGLNATKKFYGFCDGDKVTGASPTQAVRSDVFVFVVHLSHK
jgi:hypothetical protein